MTYEFQVIKVVIHHNRGLFVFAKHLGANHDFLIPEGSLLGDLPVAAEIDRIHESEDSNSPKSIFRFRPRDIERYFDKGFEKGQQVVLTIDERQAR